MRFLFSTFLFFCALTTVLRAESVRPNVILVMTDDQGYGDLGCLGNTVLRTPALDRLHAQSVRLTNYHVDPTCSPTRAALLTGRYSSRTGVWHTIMGRSILRKDETTLAQLFARSGYRTGIFGKWHLGDSAPYRPGDRGFQEVLIHGGGGVGQTPDYWGNKYFNDTYLHNGKPEKFTGYCTDVWFDAALGFIKKNRNRPFFAYIPTNAAHGPFLVNEKYSKPFRDRGVPSPRAEFYGMIANIDENMARLEKKLEELGLTENTIVIFTTDNGTAAGMSGRGGYNAGMRGTKGSQYEGGHRVPCFIRWPAGTFGNPRDIAALTAHIDLLPTLTELCSLKTPNKTHIDGRSLVPLLRGVDRWPQRTLLVHSQRVEHPEKWRKSAVMTARWRLVNGRELYDIQADPGQKRNMAGQHPRVVKSLRNAYDKWWSDISDRFDEYVRLELGAPNAKHVSLSCHDWHTQQRQIPWNQTHIRRSLKGNGFWAVDVRRAGTYQVTLRNRPAYVGHRLNAKTARLKIGGTAHTLSVSPDAADITFTVKLKAGPTKLQTWLIEQDGTSRGAYFVDVVSVK